MTDSTLNFHGLGVSDAMLAILTKAGYSQPTPIQALAIPPGLQGRDIIGAAPTGTGKTAAFIVPIVERLAGGRGTRALILAPTRELAMQIQQTVDKIGRPRRIEAALIVGGANMAQQERALRQQPEILVATPGRLLDHMWRGTVNFQTIKIFVLDEADRLLDMGFAPQIDQIIAAVPEERQTMLFSATMPADVAALAKTCLRNPVRAEVAKLGTPAAKAEQRVYHSRREDKTSLLRKLLHKEKGSTLVFTRTKSRADRLGRVLCDDGVHAAVLHGDRSTGQRKHALEGFKRGQYRVLVATDIMARGIHVNGIAHVINFDVPASPEDYIHRIGRTARAQATGLASTFVTPEDTTQLRAIERLLGQKVPVIAAGN
ncbi:MAG TPA: DEAD/DEAH box helicase [Nitrospirales bacterium]|nr:DEAD/DEAH box helicase [Nitrospirales bacterium]